MTRMRRRAGGQETVGGTGAGPVPTGRPAPVSVPTGPAAPSGPGPPLTVTAGIEAMPLTPLRPLTAAAGDVGAAGPPGPPRRPRPPPRAPAGGRPPTVAAGSHTAKAEPRP